MNATQVPLVVAVGFCAYMPVALGLLLRYRANRVLRPWRPLALAGVGCVAFFACVTPPITSLASPDGVACTTLVAYAALVAAATYRVWFFVLASSVWVRFKITEALAKAPDPMHVNAQVRWLRLLLAPSMQGYACVAVVAMSASSFSRLLAADPPCWTKAAAISIALQLVLAAVTGIYVAALLYTVSDVNAQPKAYQQTVFGGVAVLVLQGVLVTCESKLDWWIPATYHAPLLLSSLIAHIFFACSVVVPVAAACKASRDALRSVRNTVGALTSVGTDHDIGQGITVFHDFLARPEGAAAFREFARLALRLEEILAWGIARQFATKLPSRKRAWKIFATCIDAGAPLGSPAASRWRHFYLAHLKPLASGQVLADDELPDDFFDVFVVELVLDMYVELLPAFERHPLGRVWHEHLYESQLTQKSQTRRASSTFRRRSLVAAPALPAIPISEDSVSETN
ncbi:hypothetical protein ACHHYP_01547 [Achlya hypogyna]|uniref:RGS domain-containing protein n=1 Tax=Achlya hypogyna TaxID=1202772 RepID=A0A1V9Z8I8_ACHHY|nr:hypothetical protein ACHHYP_01547 [Achlya hypogyna]